MNPPTPGEGFVCENCNLGYRPTQTRSDDKWLERICCASIAHRISTHDSSLRMWSRADSFEPRRNSLERGEIDTAPRRMAPRALAEMPCARSCNSHEAAKCAAHRPSLSAL